MKKLVCAIAVIMTIGSIILVSCDKEGGASTNKTLIKSIEKSYLVCGVLNRNTGIIDYGFNFEDFASHVENYASDSLGRKIVVEKLEIEDYETSEPMLHFAYFDVNMECSFNQWVDLETETDGNNILYYTAEPQPGLWNINVFTCTGTCNKECKIIKDKETKEKSCSPCDDNVQDHACIGNTSSVDVISYVFDQIAKLSPFANLLGKIGK